MTDLPPRRSRSALATAAAGAGLAALVLFLSWPLATRAGTALVDPFALRGETPLWAKADLDLLVWILAWTGHAAWTQPTALFQANIFHPAPDALASSEHLLGLLPVSGPIWWASGNAVLTYNLTTLFVVWAAAFTTCLLVRTWSGSTAAGFVAGAMFALGSDLPLSFLRVHVSAVHLFPVLLLLAWRVATRPGVLAAAALVLATSLQVLSGVYVAFGAGVLLASFAPAVWLEARRHGRPPWLPFSLLALGAAPLALVAPAYLRVRAAGLLPDAGESRALVTASSETASHLAALLVREATPAGLVLAALGVVHAARTRPRVCIGLLLAGGVGIVLSLGVHAAPGGWPSPYELLMEWLPGFSGMRAPGRFRYATELALAVFAGFGVAASIDLAGRTLGARMGRAAAVVAVLFAGALVPWRAEHWPLPLSPDPLQGLYVGSHRWLARHGATGPVLDLPAANSAMEGRALLATGRAMLGSTLHWQPLLNGYSGHPPPSHPLAMTLAQRLPDPRAFADLCAVAAPRWIVAHFGLMPDREPAFRAAETTLPIEPVAELGRDVVYRVTCPPAPDDPASPAPSASVRGTTPAEALRADLRVETPPSLMAGRLEWIWVEVSNRGGAAWPGLRPVAPGTVTLQARFLDPATGEVTREDVPLPLARDLPPGESVRAQAAALPPASGPAVLEIELAQQDRGVIARERLPVHVAAAPSS